MMRILGWLAAASAVLVGIACGGNVVIDGNSDDGSGGTSTVSTTSSSSGVVGEACAAPTPVGTASFCGGSSSGVGAGTPTECAAFYCDAVNNIYESKCAGNTCVCSFNSKTLCTCAVSGDACNGASLGCCPFPFAQ